MTFGLGTESGNGELKTAAGWYYIVKRISFERLKRLIIKLTATSDIGQLRSTLI